MAQRAYNLGDAPTKPVVWWDAQDSATLALDASSRLSTWTSKGTNTGATFTPVSTARAPLYSATAFNGELPALGFSTSRFDLLTSTFQGPAQPATAVYVWYEPAANRSAYEVVFDHANTGAGDGGRQTIFAVYGGSTPSYLVNSSSSRVPIGAAANALGQINVMVVEYNGNASRVYLNGTLYSGLNLGTVLSAVGLMIGGKIGDTATAFGGGFGEHAIIPAVFGAGDAWDRLTQGTMWKWRRQAQIATGATYKTTAPTVDDAAPTSINGNAAATLAPIAIAASAALLIAGVGAATLGGIGLAATGAAPIHAAATSSLGAISAAGAGSAITQATAAPGLQPITSQASGQLPVTGATTSQLDSISVAAAGALPVRGSASVALDQLATSAAGELDIHGTASATLGAVTVDARAGGIQSTSGVAAATLGPITAAAVGSARISAAAGAMLAPVQATGAGSARIAATMAGQLGSITVSAAATVPLRATAAASLGPIAVISDSRLPIRATASVTLDPIGFTASALSDGEPVITPPERIVRAPAQLRLVRAIARPRIVFARG